MTRSTRRGGAATALVALVAVLAFVTGCSGGESSGPTSAPTPTGALPDAATLQRSATTAAKNLHDVRVDLEVTGTIPNLPVKSVSGYITNAPVVAAEGDADVTYNGSQIQTSFVVTGGDLWAKFGAKYSNMGKASEIYDPSVILDPQKGLGRIVESVRNVKIEGRERLGENDTIRMTGIVPGNVIGVLAPKSKLGDLPATFWVQEAAPNNLVEAHVEVGASLIDLTLSAWGVKQTVTKPGAGS